MNQSIFARNKELFEKKGLILSGKRGECLLREPFMGEVVHAEDWNLAVPNFLRRINKLRDDRAMVIMSALTIEHYLDSVLACWIPKYRTLSENRDFTFSLKLDLLDSCRLIPTYIMNYADCVRKLRNDFAHDVDADSIEELGTKKLSLLHGILQSHFGKEILKENSERDLVAILTHTVLLGLFAYKASIRLMRENIESEQYLLSLRSEAKKKLDESSG